MAWLPTADMENLARDVEKRSCASVTPTTRRTIARAAKRAEKFSRTAVFRASWERTGLARSKNSRLSRAASGSESLRYDPPLHQPIRIKMARLGDDARAF